MLTALSVRDFVLIERIDLALNAGLSALTGETGAGKSILLDALGLALGGRSDSGFLRPGSEQAAVSASFDVGPEHPAHGQLAERGLRDEEVIVLRRTLGRDGRSRAFINDQPVSVGALRDLGDLLVEIHGQNAERGLLDPAGHRALLDAYGNSRPEVHAVRAAHDALAAANRGLAEVEAAREAAEKEEAYDRAAFQELTALDPQPGEEAALSEERAFLSGAEKIADEITEAARLVGGDGGVAERLAGALRRLERAAARAAGRLDEVCAAFERSLSELQEGDALLEAAVRDLAYDPRRLETIEERLFALRGAARKFRVGVEDLPALRAEIGRRLELFDNSGARLAERRKQVETARQDYALAAKMLSAGRRVAAERLERDVAAELPPLKLERMKFRVSLQPLSEERAGPEGLEQVVFEVSSGPEMPFGAMSRIASGGELARLVLALKVVLAAQGAPVTLVFDEVDQGVGGAVADAVGERLAVLAETAQVVVVTHSPQVAARARHHLRIEKLESGGRLATRVEELGVAGRREEIARMLAGAKITDEARAAAARLLTGI